MTPLATSRHVPMRGIPSLLGASVADVEDLRSGDVGMVGLFLDHGDSQRFGKRFAARQLRYASAACGIRPPSSSCGRCLDLGDLNVFPLHPARQAHALKRQLGLIIATGAIPIVVGGKDLPFPLGDCLAGGQTRHVETAHSGSFHEGPLALMVDLAPLVGTTAKPRTLAKLLREIAIIPATQIGAVHLCGIAPDLDVDGRHEASLGVHVLQAIAAHLVGGAACR